MTATSVRSDTINSSVRQFDLNFGDRVLEDWTIVHGLREIIANALDEHVLSASKPPVIRLGQDGVLSIRDWGRGLCYSHLTQNESVEKHSNVGRVVGKFGVGLKDALATLDRHGISVLIRSCHSDITTGAHAKSGFDDVLTLHAAISRPSDPDMEGTEFVLSGAGLDREVLKEAKSLFLTYSGDKLLESTSFGQVLRRRAKYPAYIYVNGLRVAAEDNFLFSYNITSPTKALRAALNRERSNVGRSAYSERVKSILLACDSNEVVEPLVKDLERQARGSHHDEVQWTDVALQACQHLQSRQGNVVFVTSDQLIFYTGAVDIALRDGYRVIVVPDTIAAKFPGMLDVFGNPMLDLGQFLTNWHDSFEFSFIEPNELTPEEQLVWKRLADIFEARGGMPERVHEVRVSETMRVQQSDYSEALGVWELELHRIVIKRSQLATLGAFAGTILHEAAHAVSGTMDVTSAFEEALTNELGQVAVTCIGRTRTEQEP